MKEAKQLFLLCENHLFGFSLLSLVFSLFYANSKAALACCMMPSALHGAVPKIWLLVLCPTRIASVLEVSLTHSTDHNTAHTKPYITSFPPFKYNPEITHQKGDQSTILLSSLSHIATHTAQQYPSHTLQYYQ